jgi:ankyrin repeat protein
LTGAFLPDHSPSNTSLINNAIDCIRTGDLVAYKSLVNEQPTLVQQQSSSSQFILHYAAEAGSLDLVRFTLEIHAEQGPAGSIRSVVDAKSPNGITPMMLAAGQGNYDIVEELLKAGTDVDFMTTEGQTALDLATDAGHISISELLISHGADVNKSKVLRAMYLPSAKQTSSAADVSLKSSKTTKSYTAGWNDLMISAYENRIASVRRCLDAGIDIEATAPDGRTALMISASRGNHYVMEMLLEVGANIDVTNEKGWTALMIAVKNADHPTVSLLLSHGAELNHLSPDHWTALAEAAQQSLTDIMHSLLTCGADTESRSSHDWTPLMHACYIGDRHGVSLLLAAGADIEIRSQHDETPILLAAAKGHTDIVRTLLSAGGLTESSWARKVEADSASQRAQVLVHRAYPLGWTPLMVACQGGHEDIVGLLLGQGANVEPKSPMERTALEIAKENGRTGIVKMLEEHNRNQGTEKASISFYD